MERRAFIKSAAAVAGAAAAPGVPQGEVDQQRRRLGELADRDDSERWEYETTRNLASVYSGMINAQIDALCDQPEGAIRTHSVDSDGVPLCFEVTTQDDEHRIGNLVHLSAEDAEALAVDLLEQAHAARWDGEEQ